MALANLAELYDEAGSPQHAIKYYNESLRIDKATKIIMAYTILPCI